MVATPALVPPPVISWVKPPEDFVLDDTPVENDAQPLLAGALRESLELTDRLPPESLALANFGLCVQIGENLTLKAPDWFYVAQVNQIGISRKSYTPNLEGETPAIVIEFISDTDGEEYSSRPVSPFGKWYFYEQILKVPIYVIFYPDLGLLEFYNLIDGHYVLEQPNVEGRHWIAALGLFLGPWRGSKENRDGYWLRWWDETEQILPWAIEQLAQERQEKDQAQERATVAEQQAALEKQRADRLAELLRAQGINPDATG
jgi:Putative restriction endonuclease